MASTLCFVAAPDRMAVYDRRTHHGLTMVGLELDNRPGHYGRYMVLVEQCRTEVTDRGHEWTGRQVDLALYQFGEPKRRPTTA